MPTAPPWWQTAVLYQVYPRSFLDTDGDGIGDLDGVRAKLAYLRWLGVDGVWLSPIYPSPMADFGYDVSDHCAVDPTFGDLAGFDSLLGEAHASGLRVLLDWVPNHTSDRHPWFVESRSSQGSTKRNWYFWRDGSDGGRPNNWRAAFGGRAWTWDDGTRQWYLHLFLPQQPDLNWGEPEVVDAMHGVLRFWLDRGLDGFRADVIHLIAKDPTLPDQPPALAELDLAGVHDNPGVHPLLRGIRAVLDGYPGDRVMVGEVNLGSAAQLAPYYGAGDELHMVFNFSLLWAPWDAAHWSERIAESEAALAPADAWPVWVLSNHDTPRHRTRHGGSEDRARVAATVLLTLRGTPFLYAGEELGLDDAEVPEAARVDPGGRDGCRAPHPLGRPGRPRLARRALVALAAGSVSAQCRRAGRGSALDPPPVPAAVGLPASLGGASRRGVGDPRRTGRRPGLRAAGRARRPPYLGQLRRGGGRLRRRRLGGGGRVLWPGRG